MISLGILTYTYNDEIKAMTQKAIDSYREHADELIVVENGGDADWSDQCDVFIRFKENQGYTRGCNAILQAGRGDYLMVVNNDTYLLEGDIRDLCVPWTVTRPVDDSNPHHNTFSGAFFVIPRQIMEHTGILDEGMKLRFSDTQYGERLIKAQVPIKRIETVKFHHYLSQTVLKTLKMADYDEMYYQQHQA